MALKQGEPVRILQKGPEAGLPLDIYAWADHRANPVQTAEALNKLLAAHGLQIIQHENDSDEYAFTIENLM